MEPINQQPNNLPKPKQNWFARHILLTTLLLILVVITLVSIPKAISNYSKIKPIYNLAEKKFNEAENAQNISNWKTYKNERDGFEFRYPQSLDFRSVDDSNIVQAEVKSGLSNDSHVDSVLISIGVDNTKLNRESCVPDAYTILMTGEKGISDKIQLGGNLFYRYFLPNFGGCGGVQCDSGYLYTIWNNNTCYKLEYSYSMDYLEKIFSCSSPGSSGLSERCQNKSDYPKYLTAKQSQQSAIEYIDGLIEQILSTFQFTK